MPGGRLRYGAKGDGELCKAGNVLTMNEELKPDMPSEYTQNQERLLNRLQPESEAEERLVRQIIVCNYKLERLRDRLTKAWCQLNKVYDELKHDPLP